MNNDREQEFRSTQTMTAAGMEDQLRMLSLEGWWVISIFPDKTGFTAFLQRDKPANPEFLG